MLDCTGGTLGPAHGSFQSGLAHGSALRSAAHPIVWIVPLQSLLDVLVCGFVGADELQVIEPEPAHAQENH